MNSGESIRARNGLDTDLNRRRDFTGKSENISAITSGGTSDIVGLLGFQGKNSNGMV